MMWQCDQLHLVTNNPTKFEQNLSTGFLGVCPRSVTDGHTGGDIDVSMSPSVEGHY